MLKGHDLAGVPVITNTHRQRVARVVRVLSDPHANCVIGFIVAAARFGARPHVLPWSGITRVRPSAILIHSAKMIVEARQMFSVARLLDDPPLPEDTIFRTRAGIRLGKLEDIYFAADSGILLGYDVLGGEFTEDEHAHTFMPAPSHFERVGRSAIVPAKTARAMVAPHDWSSQWQTLSTAEQRVLTAILSDDLLASQPSSHRLVNMERLSRWMQGMRVQTSSRLPDGTLLVARGQVVTERLLRQVRRRAGTRGLFIVLRCLVNESRINN